MHKKLLTDVLEIAKTNVLCISDYLNARKIDNTSVKDFELGYLSDTSSIFEALKTQNWSAEEAVKIALDIKLLFCSGNNKNTYCSFFSKRLIFPIFDAYGRILALSGRTLKNEKPKYFNTAFSKGKHLYGLNLAIPSILEQNHVIVVEGYMDVLSAHRIGVKNVVAVMGTAFTHWHTTILSRYTSNISLLLDADKAGKLSATKYMKDQAPDPIMAKVTPKNLPDPYKDIDEMIFANPNLAKEFLEKK